MIRITDTLAIDPALIEETFVRAGGPGGQNVNKVSTAVQLRFDLAACETLPAEVKARAVRLAGQRLTKEGVIVIGAERYRTQERNRQDALDRLVELLKEAAYRPPKRVATRPTRASKKRRMDSKTKRGRIKQLRGRPTGE